MREWASDWSKIALRCMSQLRAGDGENEVGATNDVTAKFYGIYLRS